MDMPKAKDISKFYKFFSSFLVLLLSVLYWLGIFTQGTVQEFCTVGLFIYGVGAGTIDANIIIDTLKRKQEVEDVK